MAKYFPNKITLAEASAMQEEFSKDVVLSDEIPVDLKTIGGAVIRSIGESVTASIAILDFEKMKVKADTIVEEKVAFPAIACFKGFREGKVLADAITRFDIPDVFLIYGHGINHPRKFGIASHVGLAMNISTIAVSRELLCGKVTYRDSKKVILDNEEVIGEVVRYEPSSLPIYVSPGNKITMDGAVRIVKKTMKSVLPEPIKVAQEKLNKKLLSQIKNL